MLRWIVILLAGWWLGRLVGRILRLRARSGGTARAAASVDDRRDPGWTRQDIADADFEEIPEEE